MPSFSGVPAKSKDFVGEGGARERVEFSLQAETKSSGLCDDAGMGAFLEKRAEKNFQNK